MTEELVKSLNIPISESLKDKPPQWWGNIKIQVRADKPTLITLEETKRLD